MGAFGTFEPSQTQPQLKRLEQPVQRGLRRVVPRVNRTQDVWTRHPRSLAELLDAHGPNHLSKGGLDRSREAPLSTRACHLTQCSQTATKGAVRIVHYLVMSRLEEKRHARQSP